MQKYVCMFVFVGEGGGADHRVMVPINRIKNVTDECTSVIYNTALPECTSAAAI